MLSISSCWNGSLLLFLIKQVIRSMWMKQEKKCFVRRKQWRLPPTRDALLLHSKRVAYQSGIWCTSEQIEQRLPTLEGWGWTLDDENQSWVPVWNILPMASKACSEFVKCRCKSKSECGGRCACRKARWKCTELCSCNCEKQYFY